MLECKATNDDFYSCASFYQLKHFEEAVKHPHKAHYGVVVCFYSDSPKYVYVSDAKIVENKAARRRVRTSNPDSYDFCGDSLQELLDFLVYW